MANQARTQTRSAPKRGSRSVPAGATAPDGLRRRLLAGGTEGNERLTTLTGLLLIVLLAALGLTIIDLGGLLWLHLFLGLLLIGPVALKMASTGYRFVRYYTHNRRYRLKGPPPPALRLLAPAVVGLTVIVFLSGVVLLFIGPDSSLRSKVFLIHKAGFIAWVAVAAIHVLGHLPEVLRLLRLSPVAESPSLSRIRGVPGGSGRWLSIATALVLGLVLAVVLIPQFGSWTGAAGAAVLNHHHHHDH
jgi:hypothetical protein